MDKLQRQLNAEYAALQGSYWMAFCMVLSFASMFLLARGYSNSEIGVMLSAGNLLALILQPFLAQLADRSEKISIIHILWALSSLIAAAMIVSCLVTVRSAALTLSYAAAIALLFDTQPFITSLTMRSELHGIHINFGACRAVGSLAYAVTAAVMGAAVDRLGMASIPLSGLCCAGLLMAFLAAFTLTDRRTGSGSGRAAGAANGSGIREFFRANKRFSLFLLGTAMLFATHTLVNNFIIVVVRNVGGDSGDMGRLCGFMAILEIPAMVFFDRLSRRISCSALLRFSLVMFTVKAAAVFLAPTVGWLYAAFALQALSFAVYIPASVRYAMLVVDGKDTVKAQGFLALTSSLGSIFASLAGGAMFDWLGVSSTLLVWTAVSCAGTVVAFLAVTSTARGQKV